MKTRNGFVSNSSSASFIIHINLPKKELYPLFTEGLPEHFGFYSVESTLKKGIKGYEQELLDLQKDSTRDEARERSREFYNIKSKSDILDEELEKRLDFLQKFNKERIEHYLESLNKALTEISAANKDISNAKDDIEKIELEINYIKSVLQNGGVSFSTLFDDGSAWKLESHVTMFNDYSDAPEIFKEIISLCSFKKVKINCSVSEG